MNRARLAAGGFLCILLAALPAGAVEEESGKVAEAEDDGEMRLSAGYDKATMDGFFIRSDDGSFRLNIGAFAQVRYDVNRRDAPAGEDDVTNGFSLRTTQLYVEGDCTPRFHYQLRMQIDDEDEFSLMLAYLQYNFGENGRWSVSGGRQFLALSREDWQFADDILTTEFSANDATFAIGTSVGAQVNFTGERQRFWVAASNGVLGGKRTFSDSAPSDFTFTGRWEHQFAGKDWSVWDDIIGRRGRARGMLLGVAGAYENAQPDLTTEIESASQLNVDLSFNGDGYQALLAGSMTFGRPGTGDSFHNYGILVQGGCFFTQKLQVYGQYNLVSPGNQPGNLEEFHSITTGVSYYPFVKSSRWKFSGELGYLFDAINNTLVTPSGALGWLSSNEDGQFYARVQAQFGF